MNISYRHTDMQISKKPLACFWQAVQFCQDGAGIIPPCTMGSGLAQLALLRSMVMFIQSAEGMQIRCMSHGNPEKFTLFNLVDSFSCLCLEST